MELPILGTIALFANPRNPEGWLPCDGRSVPHREYEALHQVLGSPAVGPDGTFRLPEIAEPVPDVRPVVAVFGMYVPPHEVRPAYEPVTLGMLARWDKPAPPPGCLFAEGQTLQLAEHRALFSVLYIQFGGDGQRTFKLPDLRAHGRHAICYEGHYPHFKH